MEFRKELLDQGFVELLDWMPRTNPEVAIVQAARTSVNRDCNTSTLTKTDRNLIRRLYADQHTSPFEMVELKFVVKLPLFAARQWMRHRTGSYNEVSGRYSKLEDDFYIPTKVRSQHKTNKQMSGDEELPDEVNETFLRFLYGGMESYDTYEKLCESGVARELARIGLPQNMYTRFYYKTNLHNFLHFAKLRMAQDAQYEIRVYADAMYDMVKTLCPVTCQAFEDYTLNSVRLSGPEVEMLRKFLGSTNLDTLPKQLKDILFP